MTGGNKQKERKKERREKEEGGERKRDRKGGENDLKVKRKRERREREEGGEWGEKTNRKKGYNNFPQGEVPSITPRLDVYTTIGNNCFKIFLFIKTHPKYFHSNS